MRLVLTISIVLACAVAVSSCSSEKSNVRIGEDGIPIVGFRSEDPEMKRAIEQAQKSIPEFKAKFDKRSEGDYFAVKVAMVTKSGTFEHIWVEELVIDSKKWSGVLGNEPEDLGNLKLGSIVNFDENQITDWVINWKSGKREGGFSIALLERKAGK